MWFFGHYFKREIMGDSLSLPSAFWPLGPGTSRTSETRRQTAFLFAFVLAFSVSLPPSDVCRRRCMHREGTGYFLRCTGYKYSCVTFAKTW